MADLCETVPDDAFMSEVQKDPVIYDRSVRDCKDLRKKQNAWKEIAQSLKIDVIVAQGRYKRIRTKLSRHAKKMRGRSGFGQADLPSVNEEYEHLRWLITHIINRDSTTNLQANGRTDTVPSQDIDITEESIEIESASGCQDEDSLNMDKENNEINELQDINYHDPEDFKDMSNHVSDDSSNSSTPRAGPVDPTLCLENSTSQVEKSTSQLLLKEKKVRKRAWSKENKGTKQTVIDTQFLPTMNKISQAIKKTETHSIPNEGDEDRLFCMSLVVELKQIEGRYKAMANLQILKLINDVTWMKASGCQIHQQPFQQQPLQHQPIQQHFQVYHQGEPNFSSFRQDDSWGQQSTWGQVCPQNWQRNLLSNKRSYKDGSFLHQVYESGKGDEDAE